ncbi:hypothetical protein [Kitasatospora sp. NPDC088134]|uniref:hypothetical protein n=1 Tax=Kitasatospora sp. NPDC088134 TaxID=3364071 RepID=UPI00382B5116
MGGEVFFVFSSWRTGLGFLLGGGVGLGIMALTGSGGFGLVLGCQLGGVAIGAILKIRADYRAQRTGRQ